MISGPSQPLSMTEAYGAGVDLSKGMGEFLETKDCKRVIVDRVIDGRKSRVGCEVGEGRYDMCRGM